MSDELTWVTAQVSQLEKEFLEVAVYHTGARSKSALVRQLITDYMNNQPGFVEEAQERTSNA